MTQIVLINQTSVVSDGQVAAVVPILQTLFDRDFEPVWGTGLGVQVSVLARGDDLPAGAWPIYLLDTTDQPGAGGYHLDDTGIPAGKVFVKDAIEANESWTVDLSHEFLEMCSDPTTDVLIQLAGMPGYAALREACDACEDDSFGYPINGVLVAIGLDELHPGSSSI